MSGDEWTMQMASRGLMDKDGWFVHRIWKVSPPTVRTSHSKPLPIVAVATHHDALRAAERERIALAILSGCDDLAFQPCRACRHAAGIARAKPMTA